MKLREYFRSVRQLQGELQETKEALEATELLLHSRDCENSNLTEQCAELFHQNEQLQTHNEALLHENALVKTVLQVTAQQFISMKDFDSCGLRQFYETVAPVLDPNGFQRYHEAEMITGIDVIRTFHYEDACGYFENADGNSLMQYLVPLHFDAVKWEIVPGTTCEKAVLGTVDTESPAYQAFERELYERTLYKLGFQVEKPEVTRELKYHYEQEDSHMKENVFRQRNQTKKKGGEAR